MKKVVLLFVVAVLAGGMAQAQRFDDFIDGIPAGAGLSGRVRTDVAPLRGLLSTEGVSSAGRFTGAADGFMNPRFFNQNLEGTFLFLGGNVGLTPDGSYDSDPTRVDIGFARSLGGIYLGFYFGGGLVNAAGARFQEDAETDPEDSRVRITEWDANLAVLIGLSNMGFRIDFGIVNAAGTYNQRQSHEAGSSESVEWSRTSAPSVAVTWGANMGQLLPWARVGFRAANSEGSIESIPNYDFEERETWNSAVEIAGGARFVIDETSAVGGELWFGTTFRDRIRGSETGTDDWDSRLPGSLTGFGLSAYYQQRIEGERAALGFRPSVNAGLSWTNRNINIEPGGVSEEVIGLRMFTLNTNLDVGARWQATERIALFSGVSVRLFDWSTAAETGSDSVSEADPQYSAWEFAGVSVRNLNIGMTLAAADNITIGLRLNSFVNGLFGNQFRPNFDFTVTAMLGD